MPPEKQTLICSLYHKDDLKVNPLNQLKTIKFYFLFAVILKND
ncbi:hypothetical protein PL10110_540002 [Planktothrix agardhii]|nr:hypothetical protein PL10110_540002 [Planktothrix agardhii]